MTGTGNRLTSLINGMPAPVTVAVRWRLPGLSHGLVMPPRSARVAGPATWLGPEQQ